LKDRFTEFAPLSPAALAAVALSLEGGLVAGEGLEVVVLDVDGVINIDEDCETPSTPMP
jgi:hypothetical protein